MQATDFKYDGRWLSDLGFMICTFDSSGIENTTAGSTIAFNSIKQHGGAKFPLASVEYDEAFTTTFDICKISNNTFGQDITLEEYRFLMQWLNRSDYHLFSLVDNYDDEWSEVYFEGSFNVERINYGGRLIGLSLTFMSNRPYGFGETITETLTLNGQGYTRDIENRSDELGVLYPDTVRIRCISSGDFEITNHTYGGTTVINNCASNEEIVMDSMNQIIYTSNIGHHLYNDFNYNFFKLYRTLSHTNNVISSNNPCDITISYRPIRKVVF